MPDAEKDTGFSAAERAAMKERAKELKAEAKRESTRAEGEKDVLEKIAEMPQPDRSIAEKIHEIVSKSAPDLMPRTWYGMPAYAKDGKVLCFFQSAEKFTSRYSTFGFSDPANLDDGELWPTSFAVTSINAKTEKAIAELVSKAVSA